MNRCWKICARLALAGLLLCIGTVPALAQPPQGEGPAAGTPHDTTSPGNEKPAPTDENAGRGPSQPPEPTDTSAQKPALEPDVYVPPPPDHLVPGGRMGGSTRGPVSCPSEMLALVPEKHVGLTASAQPTLYWFVGETTSCRIDFVLNDPRTTTPRVERQIPAPHAAGIHAISLADLDVTLDPGIVYTWFVTLVPDPDARSKDVVSGGQIERVDAADVPQASPPVARARALGRRGLWYDALAALQQGIVAAPANGNEERMVESRLLGSQGLGAALAPPAHDVDVAAPPPPPEP